MSPSAFLDLSSPRTLKTEYFKDNAEQEPKQTLLMYNDGFPKNGHSVKVNKNVTQA